MSDNTTKQITPGVPPNYKSTAILRFKNTKFGPSKSEKPMITAELEVIIPDTVTSPFNGKTYALDSAKLMMWLLLWTTDKNGKELQNGLNWLNDSLLPKLGLNAFVLDESNPLSKSPLYHETNNPTGVKLDGLCVECILETEEQAEKVRQPDGSWVEMKDMKGNVIKRGWAFKNPSPSDIIGVADVDVSNRPNI